MKATGQIFGRLMLLVIGAVLAVGGAYAQSGGNSGGSGGSCTVTQLRFRFATGSDDLRGGQDNLNIAVYFMDGGYQLAANVNKSQNWPNNSVNLVVLPLSRPVPPNEIRALRLVHIADGGFNIGSLPELATPAAPIAIAQAFQSPDNWNMADVQVAALGNGVGDRIASYGFHRFTGSNPSLTILAQIPANICGSGRRTGNSGEGSPIGGLNPAVNPGGSGLHPVSGGDGGNRYGALTNDDVVRMARAKLPESEVVASIRSNPTRFDTSAGELTRLRRIGVSEIILREMQNRSEDPNNNPKAKLSVTDGGKSADELNPQPYPPKGALLNPGGQQTMLGTQANSPSANANQSALIPAVRPAITDGTTQGNVMGNNKTAVIGGTVAGAVQPAITPTAGASQAMSAQGNIVPSAVQQARTVAVSPGLAANAPVSAAARMPIAARANPNLYVAQACAKDPSYRVLFIFGNPETLTIGTQYTIWGCSFGSMPPVKPIRPASRLSQNQTSAMQPNSHAVAIYSAPYRIAWFVYADIESWSDNSIVLTFPASAAVYPHGSVAGMNLPAELWVTRGDGQTEIFGHEGGLYFKPGN